MSGSGSSNVGNRQIYQADDQRTYSADETQEKERFGEGQPNSHKPNDSKDERTIANRLEREGKKSSGPDPEEIENIQYKKDPTLPARSHGNEPSKGAKIDAEIQADEEEELRRKGKA